MTQVQTIDNNPSVMSSREIAELTGKQHDNVLRDIRKMFVELKEDVLKFEAIYFDKQNRRQTEYLLDRELTDTLLTGYSAVARRKVIARWHELEAKAAQKPAFVPADLSRLEILKMAIDSEQGRLVAEEKLAIAAPKAEALDRITLSDGAMCITNAAKVLGMQPKRLFAWMQERLWIYRRAGGTHYVGYQSRIQDGYLDHKVTTVTRSDGNEKVVEQVLVTPKGLARLAANLNQQGVAA